MATERLTTTEVARTLLEQRGIVTAGGESVSLTRNAKGVHQIEVQARTQNDESLADVQARAQKVYDDLRAAYPYPDAPES